MTLLPNVRTAKPEDFAGLPALEAAADTLLAGMLRPGPVLPPPAIAGELAGARHLLVAGDPPVGFARLEEVDGQAHLEQLSVHPAAAGAGLGRRLVSAALDWARSCGYTSMTLCTFAGIPFNAPFYQSCGFYVVAEPGGELARLRRHERALGLDTLGERVAMRRDLAPLGNT